MNKKYLFFLYVFILIPFTMEAQLDTEKFLNPQKGKPGGIVFFCTRMLDSIRSFYIDRVGCELWLDQGSCIILKHGNQLIGFCKADKVDKDGTLTFFYTKKEYINEMYRRLRDISENPPLEDPQFFIYHFYARDPEERMIEFQFFNHEIPDF